MVIHIKNRQKPKEKPQNTKCGRLCDVAQGRGGKRGNQHKRTKGNRRKKNKESQNNRKGRESQTLNHQNRENRGKTADIAPRKSAGQSKRYYQGTWGMRGGEGAIFSPIKIKNNLAFRYAFGVLNFYF